MTLEEKKTRAAGLLMTKISWYAEDRGTLTCPGATLHTKPTGEKDTIIYLDGVPTLFCYHESCREFIEDGNKMLRNELAPRSPEEKEQDRLKSSRLLQLSCDAKKILSAKNKLVEEYAWEGLLHGGYNPTDSWNKFLRMWGDQDVIWIGEVWDTGPVKGPGHFYPVSWWRQQPPNFYANHFTTTSTFRPLTLDRCLRQVASTPYVVVEFDQLSPDTETNRREGAAFLNYLRRTVLDLFAVVDSGNKSLHGWFLNNERFDDEARYFLRSLGADTKTMRPAQPVRLPGGRRENGNPQSLLWINQ